MSTESLTIAGRPVTVRQLTMRQIRNVMAHLKKKEAEPHIVDVVFNDSVPAIALAEASGLSLEELAGDFDQQDIADLLAKVKAINPFFVGMTERIIQGTPSGPSSRASVS